MQPNFAAPRPVTGAGSPPPDKPSVGTYVLYRDVDALLTGDSEHTKIARVVRDGGYAPAGHVLLVDLKTNELIQYAPIIYTRAFNPEEFMHDIDTAPLALAGKDELLSGAAAWLITQRGGLAGVEPAGGALGTGG